MYDRYELYIDDIYMVYCNDYIDVLSVVGNYEVMNELKLYLEKEEDIIVDKEKYRTYRYKTLLGNKKDNVNKPNHYVGDNGLEVEQVLQEFMPRYENAYVAHRIASAVEYVLRSPLKNGLEDLKKARKNLDQAIEYLENDWDYYINILIHIRSIYVRYVFNNINYDTNTRYSYKG